jgi:Zn-dependent protease
VVVVDPQRIIHALLTVVTMVLSVTVHEYAHALAAHKLGDDYAAREGRLNLNPMSHADPVGTLLFPGMAALMGWGGFGWGRPVPYIPGNLTRKYSMRAGEAIIAFAGPFANLIMGVICAGLLIGLLRLGVIGIDSPFVSLLDAMLDLNILLFFFNLLPVPPLDGSKIAAWLFGQRADKPLDAIANAGFVALIACLVFGGMLIGPMAGRVTALIRNGFVALL